MNIDATTFCTQLRYARDDAETAWRMLRYEDDDMAREIARVKYEVLHEITDIVERMVGWR